MLHAARVFIKSRAGSCRCAIFLLDYVLKGKKKGEKDTKSRGMMQPLLRVGCG